MKRTNYNIACNLHGEYVVKSIPGYVVSVDGLLFGVSKWGMFSGKIKDAGEWMVTELTTGYACLRWRTTTRQAALDQLVTMDKWPAIKSTAKNNIEKGMTINPDAEPSEHYDVWSTHTA